MHIKRNNIGNFWPIPRKGTKYLAVPKHNKSESISLVVVIRDILKLVKNKKELKRLLNGKKVLVNQKIVRDTNYPIAIFDIINLPELKKNYKANLSKDKKMIFEEVNGKESETRVYKIINKQILPNKKIQLNLSNGRNIITNEKAKTGDSLMINLKDNKIEKILPLEKSREAFVVNGKHAGYFGKIEDIVERGGKTLVKISSEIGKINVWTKNIIIIK